MSFWRITKDGRGAGGFISPPGHPSHKYVALEHAGQTVRSEITAMLSIDTAAAADDVPDHIRDHARLLLISANLYCSPLWVRMVYGYFRSCWVPDSGSTAAQDLHIGPRPKGWDDDRHAAVAHIRRYFPSHQPVHELIENPGNGYGSQRCELCDKTVQYEPRYDTLLVFGETPGGGCAHSVTMEPRWALV